MRLGLSLIVVCLLSACGNRGICGEDEEGSEIPSCIYDVEGVEDVLEYCPGEHWADTDGCNSCGCDADGTFVCTTANC